MLLDCSLHKISCKHSMSSLDPIRFSFHIPKVLFSRRKSIVNKLVIRIFSYQSLNLSQPVINTEICSICPIVVTEPPIQYSYQICPIKVVNMRFDHLFVELQWLVPWDLQFLTLLVIISKSPFPFNGSKDRRYMGEELGLVAIGVCAPMHV